jgi:hypothetical protein
MPRRKTSRRSSSTNRPENRFSAFPNSRFSVKLHPIASQFLHPGTVNMKKQPPIRTILFVLGILLLGIFLLLGTILLVKKNTPPTLPALDDISSITLLHGLYHKNENSSEMEFKEFEVASAYWPDIYDALTPYEMDRHPADWHVLGALLITTKQGASIRVDLYFLNEKSIGAFAIADDPADVHRTYFRGGNSLRLQKALIEAYEKTRVPREQPSQPQLDSETPK